MQGDVFKLLESYNYDNINSSINGAGISKVDAIIIDPPRDGLGRKLVSLISKLNAKKVIYVSCNAATLARDIKNFDDVGYKAKTIYPMDMFPHTEYVECVVLIERS